MSGRRARPAAEVAELARRGRGRPAVGPVLGVRVPPALRAELDEWAAADGVPVAELVRRELELVLAKHRRRNGGAR